MSASVVRIIAAMLAAFSRAERVTLAASITPASTMSSVFIVEDVVADMLVLLLLLCPAHRLDDHRAILASVRGDRAQRLLERATQNLDASRLRRLRA